jgi:hypothetical protein
MISLEQSLAGMRDAQDKLRNATAIVSPVIISEQMFRLSQFAGLIDEHLAEYEKEYEVKLSARILQLVGEGYKFSPAETNAKCEMAEIKSQILYLTRLSGSAWRQVTTAQSRYNHLNKESYTNL